MRLSAFLLWMSGVAMAQSTGTFTSAASMNTDRMSHTATLLTTGKVLIAGGRQIVFTPAADFPIVTGSELYDPSTGTFTAIPGPNTPRAEHTATLLPDGKVLIAGGSTLLYGSLATAELYDPSTGLFTATGVMTASRRRHTATLLNSGKVLIAGGTDGAYPEPRVLTSAELYDPSTGTFTPTGAMSTAYPRDYGVAVLLASGKVLIPRARSDDDPTPAELYDPDTGTFSLTGETGHAGQVHPTAASLLPTGKVLLALDFSCDPGDAAEVYDPASGAFLATGNMTAHRGDNNATLLPDGKVLVDGMAYGVGWGKTDLYDPVAGSFSLAGEMRIGRQWHSSTLLPDGTVLISGGWTCCGYTLASAEIYHPPVLVPSPVLLSSPDGRGDSARRYASIRFTGQPRGCGRSAGDLPHGVDRRESDSAASGDRWTIGAGVVLRQRSWICRFEPSERPGPEQRRAGGCGWRALDLSQPPEQRGHDRRSLT